MAETETTGMQYRSSLVTFYNKKMEFSIYTLFISHWLTGCCLVKRLGVVGECGTSENVGLRKFWQDLEIFKAFLISLEVLFLHGLFLLFSSLKTFYQGVSG